MNIAVLIATFKKKEETLKCLKLLNSNNFKVEVFIADSNSKNNIEQSLTESSNIHFKNVGDEIYWNQGMILAWKEAFKFKEFDFYIWLNNDTYLYEDAIKTMLENYNSIEGESLIIGSTQYENKLTYGGRLDLKSPIIESSGFPMPVKIINGNCVLVSKNIFKKLGYLNKKFTHSLGDIDYGLRAIENRIGVYSTSKIIGECMANPYIWYDEKNIIDRIRALNSPKGTPLNEYLYFNYYHFGVFNALKFILASIFALLFPKFYKLLKTK